jgi:iron(III) transport system substrate-binding protein
MFVRRWSVGMLAVALCATACARDSRTVLKVYSPLAPELLDDFARRFERENPSVDVQAVELGSQELLERVRAESAHPQGDVWFGAPADIFEQAARAGVLEPYAPTWSTQVGDDMRDSSSRWYGVYLTPQVIGYNASVVSTAQMPREWNDLVAPKWHGKLVLRDPATSGVMRVFFGAMLQRSLRETGHTDAGFAWLRALDANTREYVRDPAALYQHLGRKDGVVTIYNMPDLATLEQRTKIPVAYVLPAAGTPVLVDGIAILKGAPHPELARRFYEFITSREGVMIAAREYQRLPVRRDLAPDSLPAWVARARAAIVPMPLDRTMLADSLDGWIQTWTTTIRRRAVAK